MEKNIYIYIYLRPVNARGSNNVKEHKAHRKNGKGSYMCGFHMYPRFFMKFLQILHGQLSRVHCLILCLKILRLSDFFISFGKFHHRTAPIVVIVSKPDLFVLIFLLVTVTPDQEAFSSKVKISFMIGGDSPILTLYISVNKYCKFL